MSQMLEFQASRVYLDMLIPSDCNAPCQALALSITKSGPIILAVQYIIYIPDSRYLTVSTRTELHPWVYWVCTVPVPAGAAPQRLYPPGPLPKTLCNRVAGTLVT